VRGDFSCERHRIFTEAAAIIVVIRVVAGEQYTKRNHPISERLLFLLVLISSERCALLFGHGTDAVDSCVSSSDASRRPVWVITGLDKYTSTPWTGRECNDVR
jgi:hypothetical protein